MFRPRHAYRSPVTSRYRGKAKGCPVFNNLFDVNSNMVEQHDECLECLAKIKNRTDLYRTLADDNKPSNNVIKSLQRLSSSASNNRLKTCLQFLIIKVNEKSISTPQQTTTTGSSSISNSPKTHDSKDSNRQIEQTITGIVTTKHHQGNRRHKSHNQQQKQRQISHQKQKHNQLASPPQDQVSSTQDQVSPTQDDHDCQTSPLMLVTTQIDEVDTGHPLDEQIQDSSPIKQEDSPNSPIHTQSSPSVKYSLTTTTSTTNTSPSQTKIINTTISSNITRDNSNNNSSNNSSNSRTSSSISSSGSSSSSSGSSSSSSSRGNSSTNGNSDSQINDRLTESPPPPSKRRKIHINSDHDTSSTASWSSTSYTSPQSPISTSSTSSISSSSSRSSTTSCSSSLSPSPSASPLSSPDIVNELKGPRLKLSEEKIKKIKERPVLFDDYFMEHSSASTPTTSSGCSPGQHSNMTQNSDQSRSGISTSNMVIHMFQAPPRFVNTLKPCNLPAQLQEPSPAPTPAPAPTKVEMLNCAICGIKDRPPNISKVYGQNSCLLCTRFFSAFLKRPQQLYCAQDGDCLMTFDSRCQACWIKICLQKFDIEEEHRKTGQKYSPKLLSSPNVSLITIDTSLSR